MLRTYNNNNSNIKYTLKLYCRIEQLQESSSLVLGAVQLSYTTDWWINKVLEWDFHIYQYTFPYSLKVIFKLITCEVSCHINHNHYKFIHASTREAQSKTSWSRWVFGRIKHKACGAVNLNQSNCVSGDIYSSVNLLIIQYLLVDWSIVHVHHIFKM